jgi:hypothetical protein
MSNKKISLITICAKTLFSSKDGTYYFDGTHWNENGNQSSRLLICKRLFYNLISGNIERPDCLKNKYIKDKKFQDKVMIELEQLFSFYYNLLAN